MAVSSPHSADAIVVGGGFYGACIALFLRSVYSKVLLVEAEDTLLTRASLVNQARIHTGYHYPRSFVTARRSLALRHRFAADFRDAVVDDFTMLYAIARQGSKISPQRFEHMFHDMGAPLAPANGTERDLFDPLRIAAVFRCEEFAFDAVALRRILSDRLDKAGVEVRLGTRIDRVSPGRAVTVLSIQGGGEVKAPLVVNATYGRFVSNAERGFISRLKYELTEVAMVSRPPELEGVGVTVMDGPFFSIMPYPARTCYSLTHVRYTPHYSWQGPDPDVAPVTSNWKHMQRDAARFMPCLHDLEWQGSLYEVKTVLMRNEGDDGRPIHLSRTADAPGYLSVLGGKLDNIYDLFDVMRGLGPELAAANAQFVSGELQGTAA